MFGISDGLLSGVDWVTLCDYLSRLPCAPPQSSGSFGRSRRLFDAASLDVVARSELDPPHSFTPHSFLYTPTMIPPNHRNIRRLEIPTTLTGLPETTTSGASPPLGHTYLE
jgi:hypothetical protein